ncbi:Hypothetical predicted protein, partial [Mytilus galloprovincialis]
ENDFNVKVFLPGGDHDVDTTKPWLERNKKTNPNKSKHQSYEEGLLTNIWYDLDTLVCFLIIKVYFEIENSELFGKISFRKLDYPSALTIHLLKNEKWRIREEHLTKSFDQKILNYIYEEELTNDLVTEQWKSLSNMGYKPPKNKTEDSICRIKQTDWDSKGFGHIFFALLKKHHFTGAMQLIETGNIRIHYIIIGCVILEDEANDWKTTPLVKEKLQCAKKALTATAVRITSCIYEADKEAKSNCSIDDGTCYKKAKKCVKGKNSEYINHAGRLLLNHGYMRDAIDTGNMAYLENDTIKNILNKMWFGTKEVNWTWQT